MGLIRTNNESFKVGSDDFGEIVIGKSSVEKLYYFQRPRDMALIKRFILDDRQRVIYVCDVTLIKKGEKFTPRLDLLVIDKTTSKPVEKEGTDANIKKIKAHINLDKCHENFWKLISFLESLRDIEIPKEKFSLITQDEGEIIEALRERDSESKIEIIKALASLSDVNLTEKDIQQLQNRRKKLEIFQQSLAANNDEKFWQDFFEENKWIFGYGLNYQILRQEVSQPSYGGTLVEGKGGQVGDYLTSTLGEISFTVPVEIKTPATPLIQGQKEIRNGAWSLAKELTDAISQIEANIYTWEQDGSQKPRNVDNLEGNNIYTVRPKGIIVIGDLSEISKERNKRETFQRFRRSIVGLEIITFDELFERAKYIVEAVESKKLD